MTDKITKIKKYITDQIKTAQNNRDSAIKILSAYGITYESIDDLNKLKLDIKNDDNAPAISNTLETIIKSEDNLKYLYDIQISFSIVAESSHDELIKKIASDSYCFILSWTNNEFSKRFNFKKGEPLNFWWITDQKGTGQLFIMPNNPQADHGVTINSGHVFIVYQEQLNANQ